MVNPFSVPLTFLNPKSNSFFNIQYPKGVLKRCFDSIKNKLDAIDWNWNENNKISLEIDGIVIYGEIVVRKEFHLEVAIISPFINWNKVVIINGDEFDINNNFLSNNGYTVGREILGNIYNKIKIIDDNIDSICIEYNRHKEYCFNVKANNHGGIQNRIINTANHWFFNQFIFENKYYTSDEERILIVNVLEKYIEKKEKTYLATNKNEWSNYGKWIKENHENYLKSSIKINFYKWINLMHPEKIRFNPTFIEIKDEKVIFGMYKNMGRLSVSIAKINSDSENIKQNERST
jgi:hypothetical protein